MQSPFVLIAPASRGLSLALTRHYLRTTNLPVFATHRSDSPGETQQRILSGMHDIDTSRLNLLHLDLTQEDSIASAADSLANRLDAHGNSPGYIHTAFFTGGILHPERQPGDLHEQDILETFKVNTISHLLLIKHFSRFLPSVSVTKDRPDALSKWVHVSARVGSVSDNHLGGWYSYRASKAALNQVVRTFDLYTMSLTLLSRRAAPRSLQTTCNAIRTFSTPVNDSFSPSTPPPPPAGTESHVLQNAVRARGPRYDWTRDEIREIYNTPLMDLTYQSVRTVSSDIR